MKVVVSNGLSLIQRLPLNLDESRPVLEPVVGGGLSLVRRIPLELSEDRPVLEPVVNGGLAALGVYDAGCETRVIEKEYYIKNN